MPIQQLPLLPPSDGTSRWRRLAEAINQLIKAIGNFFGGYEATFQSGQVVYGGPDNTLTTNANFRFGVSLPNASGINSPGVFVGGAGQTQVVYITDEQLPGQKGITVIFEAGDASATAPANWDGGDLLNFAGGTLSGNGGTAKYQGGTSVHGRAGDAILHGGNTTDGTPGNAVVIGGETGPVGANVLLIATKPPGASGFGDVRIQANSTVLIQFLSNGEIYLTASGSGAGLAGQPLVSGGIGAAAKYQTGFTGTKVIGADTYHYSSGIVTSIT